MSKKTFLRGAAILGIAGLIVQVMGAIFRIPLGNMIGEEGMGYYQTVYPIYIFLLVFSTNGAPAAISKMAAERLALGRADEAHRVFRLSFVFMTAFGIVASAVVFFGAETIIDLTASHQNAYYAMIAISPALLLIPIMSVYRGYFQGMQEMGPTALSQFFEQAIRVGTGLALAFIWLPQGVEYAAAGATLGTSIGPIAGIAILVIVYLARKNRIWKRIQDEKKEDAETESAGSILKTLAMIAVPITIGVSILPIMNLADVALVMRRLQESGYSENAANALYGALTGFAGPIINIPMALALSMALSLVPAIASAKSTGDFDFLNMNVRLGLRTAMIVGVPCSFGLIALAQPIMLLIYPLQEETAKGTAGCLAILAAGIIFLCVAQTMAGILQGLNRIGLAVWSLAAGFAVKCVVTYMLTGVPTLNVEGAAIGSTLGYATVAVLSFLAVRRITNVRFDFGLSVGKPLIAGVVMGVLVVAIQTLLPLLVESRLITVLAICVGAAAYGVMLLRIKAITAEEIAMLPKGAKLVSLLAKLRLV